MSDKILKNENDENEEKSFNEAELEDIMSEIEDLEKDSDDDFEDEVPQSSIEEKVEEVTVKTTSDDYKKDNISSIQTQASPKVEEYNTTLSDKDSMDTQMDFSVSGNMNLKLNFRLAQKTIKLYINEKSGFIIEMDGGIKFTIPLSSETIKDKNKQAS